MSRKDKIRDLWESGQPAQAIATELKCGVSLVKSVIITLKKQQAGVLMANLDFSGCRYPIGESADGHLFCNRKALESKPYCEKHNAIAYLGKKK